MSESFLPVRLGDSWLVLDASVVREVSAAIEWIAIGGAPPGFPGVLAWNGRAVAVCDLASLLDLEVGPLAHGSRRARTVVIALESDVVALPVDGAREAFSALEGLNGRSPVDDRPYVSELIEHDGILMAKVDLLAVVADAHRRARGA